MQHNKLADYTVEKLTDAISDHFEFFAKAFSLFSYESNMAVSEYKVFKKRGSYIVRFYEKSWYRPSINEERQVCIVNNAEAAAKALLNDHEHLLKTIYK